MNRRAKPKKIKYFTPKMQAKLLLVFCVIIVALIGLIIRLVYLNQKDGEKYAKRVLSQQTYTSNSIPYRRGSILDRKGTVLATSQKVYHLVLDVKYMLQEKEENLKPTINALVETYDSLSKDELMKIVKTKPESQYVKLLKNLTYEQMAVFKDKMEKDSHIKGVWFEEDYIRQYPYKSLASHVIGFTASGNVGTWGIEQYYNDDLNGTNGREYGYFDSELNLERNIKPAVNGNTVVSTIDANVQNIVQKQVDAFNEEYGSKNIGVLIMNPNNGEIYAMASNKAYDLNNPTDLTSFYNKKEIAGMNEDEKMEALNKIWRNFTISDAFEPGSTFKPVTVASALEEGIVSPNSTYICDGYEEVGGYEIKCSNRTGHGELTLQEALMKSCNDAMMQIVAKEGKKLFYQYQNSFGLGEKVGIDLPGEASGILMAKKDRNNTALATNSFGQNFTSTMLQVAAAYSSLINGGYYYQPHVAKEIINDEGATVKAFDKNLIRKTASRETSDFIKEAMFQTVEAGTAKTAAVSGYTVGGKTGTAQKLPRAAKTYIVSFIGNVPADNPEVVIYVAIDEPQNVIKQADSSLATKLASKILAEVLPFLEVYPSNDEAFTENESNTGDNSKKNTEHTSGTDTKTNKNNNSLTNQSNEVNNTESGQETNPNGDGTTMGNTPADGTITGDTTADGTGTDGTTTEDNSETSDEFDPDALTDLGTETGE